MLRSILNEIEKKLPTPLGEGEVLISKTRVMRILLGILGLSLPLILYGYNLFYIGIRPLESMSHYYYTRIGFAFEIIMSVFGIFLMVYKGRNRIDFWLSFIAGISILLVVIFPTTTLLQKGAVEIVNKNGYKEIKVTFIDPTRTDDLKCCFDDNNSNKAKEYYVTTVLGIHRCRETVHYIFAAIFLLCLIGMTFFVFPINGKPGIEVGFVYKFCGFWILFALMIMIIRFIMYDNNCIAKWYDNHSLTFWMESLALCAFGVAWLLKVKEPKEEVKYF